MAASRGDQLGYCGDIVQPAVELLHDNGCIRHECTEVTSGVSGRIRPSSFRMPDSRSANPPRLPVLAPRPGDRDRAEDAEIQLGNIGELDPLAMLRIALMACGDLVGDALRLQRCGFDAYIGLFLHQFGHGAVQGLSLIKRAQAQ